MDSQFAPMPPQQISTLPNINMQGVPSYGPQPYGPQPTPSTPPPAVIPSIELDKNFIAISGTPESVALLPDSYTIGIEYASHVSPTGEPVTSQRHTRIYRIPPGIPVGDWSLRGYRITNSGTVFGYPISGGKTINQAPRHLLRYLCVDKTFESLDTLTTNYKPQEWLIPGFIPDKVVSLIYGRGGIGKTTWLAWAVAQISARGGNVGVLLVEEHIARFATMIKMMGGDITKVYAMDNAGGFLLPRDQNVLGQAIASKNLKFIAIDSIYAHFENVGGNAAEKARMCMTPLASLAIGWEIGICGMFHENKAGGSLGSVELPNVARHVIHATSDAPMSLAMHIEKSNCGTTGSYRIFHLEQQPLVDSEGKQYVEYNIDGEIRPSTILTIGNG